MRRRDLLKAAAAATFAAGAAPRLGRAADRAKTLAFVAVADLSVLDPVVTGNRPTRNSAYLVFDTLYGIDTEWKAQPQMVGGHDVAEDGLTWNLKLREGLRFHDKEPVLARDVVASIRRFAPRVIFARALMDATDELSAPDDRTVRFRLKRPWPDPAATCRRSCRSVWPRSRHSSRSPKSSAAAPTVSSRTSISAAPAPRSSGSICISRAMPRDLGARSASPPAPKWRISIASSG